MRKITISATFILGLIVAWFIITMIYVGVHTSFAAAEEVSMIAKNNHYDIHYDGNTCLQWQVQYRMGVREVIPVTILHPAISVLISPINDFDLIQIQECRNIGVG
jgi:hypothetical protein|tara:strand:+ start:349 stop:663 length:315 start_codon:yes stop_codon:yes gene_type:complete